MTAYKHLISVASCKSPRIYASLLLLLLFLTASAAPIAFLDAWCCCFLLLLLLSSLAPKQSTRLHRGNDASEASASIKYRVSCLMGVSFLVTCKQAISCWTLFFPLVYIVIATRHVLLSLCDKWVSRFHHGWADACATHLNHGARISKRSPPCRD